MATRAGARRSLPLVAILGLATVTGFYCARHPATGVPTPTVKVAAQLAPDSVRDQLLREADSNYTYGPNRPPLPVSDSAFSGPGGTLPEVQIATATRTDSAGRVLFNHFVARVMSSGSYATMGLAPGDNYIWRDSVSGGASRVRTLIVPRNRAYPMVIVRSDSGRYLHNRSPEPRLIENSFGISRCDWGCSLIHCEWRVAEAAFTQRDVRTIRIFQSPAR
jgi:hypothetical protein